MTARPRKFAPTYHSKRDVEWIQSDWFCPACGKRDMWQEVGSGGDYYHDCTVKCGSCAHVMCCVEDVRDEPEKEAPWWDEVSAQKVGSGTEPQQEHADPTRRSAAPKDSLTIAEGRG